MRFWSGPGGPGDGYPSRCLVASRPGWLTSWTWCPLRLDRRSWWRPDGLTLCEALGGPVAHRGRWLCLRLSGGRPVAWWLAWWLAGGP